MSNVRALLIGFTIVFITIIAGTTTAQAQRKMLVLIDASGSMTTPRMSDPIHPTRFDAAKALAEQRINEQNAVSVLSGVAVYTFSDFTSTLQTGTVANPSGFVSVSDALDKIDTLDLFTIGGGSTPLAGSMCDAVDALKLEPASFRILQVSSDGEENSTPVAHLCAGPFSVDPEPFTAGSWQKKVLLHFDGSGVQTRVDLFDSSQISLAARIARGPDPEGNLTAAVKVVAAFAAAAADGQPPTLAEFFAVLARVTGGQLTVIGDNDPVLPVYADMNNDHCVDRTDALLLARQFGKSVPPADGIFDLTGDGKIGFADYQLLLNNRTAGCGIADPYVPRAPVVCTASRPVVIDGQSIEGGGITVDVHGACVIIVKNSLIVSGQNAINVLGSALLLVDNSIIVGEHAVLSSRGATTLSAANSVFHGAKLVTGAFLYNDRGGNTWE
jgi:hypothetical protein